MTQDFAALEFDVDYGGGIGTQTVRFEMGIGEAGKASIEEAVRTGYLVNNQFDDIISFILSIFDADEALRRGIHLDVGGGQHVFNLTWQTPTDTTKPGGGNYQWGSSSNPNDGPNEHTATGGTAFEQQAVFMNAFRQTTVDSLTPATFTVGEYSSSGILDNSLSVVVESPDVNYPIEQPKKADGTLTIVETLGITNPIDAQQRPTDRG